MSHPQQPPSVTQSPFMLNLRDGIDALLDASPEGYSQRSAITETTGAEPLSGVSRLSHAEDSPRDTLQQPPPTATGSSKDVVLRPRDAAAILHLVRLRVLSYDQLTRLVYVGVHPSVARRRMRKLAAQGWVRIWEKPTTTGGSPRYVYPAKRALAWGEGLVRAEIVGARHERLVEQMLPATPRQPWELRPGALPLFLAHTQETNELVVAWHRAADVAWASSWDCPFPDHLEWRTMPQPDYVLVLRDGGVSRLVFGEHDRSTEARAEIARKLRVYATWLEHPELAEATFGFASFTVLITVNGKSPLRRVAQLAEAARAERADAFTRLAVASWASVDPTRTVWFHPAEPPRSLTDDLSVHRLSPPFPPATTHA